MFANMPIVESISIPKCITLKYYESSSDADRMDNMFNNSPLLKHVTIGYTGPKLIKVQNFPGNAPKTCVFHCTGDAPEKVDVAYKNGSWQVISNGTYEAISWIKGTGSQCINTGYIPMTNSVIVCECDLEVSSNVTEMVFGSGYNKEKMLKFYSENNNNHRFSFARNTSTFTSAEVPYSSGHYTIVISNDVLKAYNQAGELVHSITSLCNANCESPLGLFCVNTSSSSSGFSPSAKCTNMKLYRFCVYENGELKMDLRPYLGNDNEPCLLDEANDKLPHFNFGTGRFEYQE